MLMVFPALTIAGEILLINNDSLYIPVGEYVVVHFGIPPAQSENTEIKGTIRTYPSMQKVELLLLHLDDYYRWVHDPQWDVDTLGYVSSLSDSFSFPVDAFGSMSLIISNRGNLTGSTAVCSVTVAFTGSGIPDDPLFDALHIFLVLLVITASAAVIGAVYVEIRKKRKG